MVFGRRRQLKRNIVHQIRERACYGDKFRISNVPKAALTGTPDDGVEDEEEGHLIHPQQKFISARHAQLVEILSVLSSLSDHYQVSNYENADYELLYDAVDNLDRVILELQDEAGWLVAVRSLTSLTSTKSIVNHLCENAKVKPSVGNNAADTRQKEPPKELSEQVQQIRIEDEQLDCCVKPVRADLLYIIQTPAMINKICKMATRVPPTEHGICSYDDVISPWIFTTFNEDLGTYFGKSRTHYYHMVERVYKIFAIRLLNLVATEPFGCQMLIENGFVGDLVERLDFVFSTEQSMLVNTLQIFAMRIIYAVQEFGVHQYRIELKPSSKMGKLSLKSKDNPVDRLVIIFLNFPLKSQTAYWLCQGLTSMVKTGEISQDHSKMLIPAIIQRLLKNEYFGLEDLSGMCYLLGALLYKHPNKFLTLLDRACPSSFAALLIAHPIECHYIVRKLSKIPQSEGTKASTKLQTQDFFIKWILRACEAMGGTDTMNLGLVNSIITIFMELSSCAMPELKNLLLKIEKDCKDIEKFKEKSALVYVFQFMFFWKKHYTDRAMLQCGKAFGLDTNRQFIQIDQFVTDLLNVEI
ncbi:Oidioi.mRNA.OKI2018_I69.XSR.g15883.t1.cds [Oikopleura dioica]|uniref:Oidioi.mRNA.OKI2018_I69.XSR.g15883.t1.cds n=1 Tax=Oikopleura dioica TaxID=34765 RepID=A0ABN7SJD8_OIKDI|nr:Oidioi.mRNA.OKI2018_I69.XSR.g15883.t1.cds [Oikopleura dioica]